MQRITMPQTPHVEQHFTASESARDIVIGMSDGLTFPFVLAAGLSGAVASSGIVVTGPGRGCSRRDCHGTWRLLEATHNARSIAPVWPIPRDHQQRGLYGQVDLAVNALQA